MYIMNTLFGSLDNTMLTRRILPFVFLFLMFKVSFAQTNLNTFLEKAVENYPSIAAEQARAEASRTDLRIEKNTFLPSLDASYQANYATYNNITGMSYPGTVVPISGPPSSDNVYNGVPGSAASLLFKWEPITFGQRSAAITYNEKVYEKQLAGVEDEILKTQYRVAFIYLEIATTTELIKAYRKNIERSEYNVRQVNTLVTAGIRPGVDSLQFKGELSKTRTELYGLQNLLEGQKQELMELVMEQDLNDFETDNSFVSVLPYLPQNMGNSDTLINPTLKMAQFDTQANEAMLSKINRSWAPKLEFWGTGYGRGSGIGYDGTVNPSDGWSFSRYNYGFGGQLVFPILGLREKGLMANKQKALLQSSVSTLDRTKVALKKQENTARGDLATALRIAKEIPEEYKAKEEAYRALQTRYQTGLIDYNELIQAQYDLLNAESRLKNTYINAWKMLLKLAVIRGDITIFLNQIQA